MKNIIIIISLFFVTEVFGKIEIANIFPNTSTTECLGAIQLNLTGNGGTFSVTVEETGLILEEVEGLVTIDMLCNGNYTIVVTLIGFPQCETILYGEVVSVLGIQGNTNNIPTSNEAFSSLSKEHTNSDHRIIQAKSININPNPNTGRFKIIYNDELINSIYYKIFSSTGQLILTEKLTEKEIFVNLSGIPTGTYFIQFIEGKQIINTQEFIIH